MAKRTNKTTVFLIIARSDEQQQLTADLRAAGYVVHDYMTVREFLIDKPNHSSGVVVAGHRLAEMTGLELAAKLTDERTAFPVVLIIRRIDSAKVMAAKVFNVVVRPVKIESVLSAITKAIEGEEFTNVELERAFRNQTGRETEITTLVVDGKSNREIAALLDISVKTVIAHRERIMVKTRADNVVHLARLWQAWNR